MRREWRIGVGVDSKGGDSWVVSEQTRRSGVEKKNSYTGTFLSQKQCHQEDYRNHNHHQGERRSNSGLGSAVSAPGP